MDIDLYNLGVGTGFLLRTWKPHRKDHIRIKSIYMRKSAINKIKRNWVIIFNIHGIGRVNYSIL